MAYAGKCFDNSLTAADVELVHRCEVGWREPSEVLARLLQPLEDRSQ